MSLQKRFLFVNPFGIGDVLFTVQLVEEVRRHFPDAIIGFVCNERVAGLMRLNRAVDQIFVFNRGRFRRLWLKSPVLFFKKIRVLLKTIKQARFDTLVDLSLAHQYSFAAWAIGIHKRVGFDFKGRGIFLTHKKKLAAYEKKHVVDTQFQLLEYLNVPRPTDQIFNFGLRLPKESFETVQMTLKKEGYSKEEQLIAIAPGGGRSWGEAAIYKQWDIDSFAAVANALSERIAVKFILLGDEKDRSLLHKLADRIRLKCLIFSGEAMENVCALLKEVRILLCNDGGLLHLANALRVSTLSIYGPVDERVYGPYGNGCEHIALSLPVPCRTCYQKFVFSGCNFERRCLTGISPERVTQALCDLLRL